MKYPLGFVGEFLFSIVTVMSVFSAASRADEDQSGKGIAYVLDKDFPKLPPDFVREAVSAVAIDSKDNIFVFHRGTHPLIQLDRLGKLKRAFGEGLIASAHGLRIDEEDCLWVTDNASHTVIKFNPHGEVMMTLGKKNQAGDDTEHFNKPTDVAFGKNGDFYVADGYGNSRVCKFNKKGEFLFQWGTKGTGPGEFHLPHAIQVDGEGQVYVGDRENDRIQIFDANGKYLRQITGVAPFGLYLTGDRQLFVADGRANKVVKMTVEGQVLCEWGTTGDEAGNFRMPHGLTVARDGAVYVTEITGKRVQKFSQKKS